MHSEMSTEATRNILISIDAGNIVFQTLCCYLLTSIYRTSRHKTPQQLYLINLAGVEVFANAFLLARDVVNQNVQRGTVKTSSEDMFKKFFWCMNMFYVTGVSYLYVSAMFYLTADRLCIVVFQSTYQCKMTIR